MQENHFDRAAAGWDAEPRRVEIAKAIGEAILRQVRPTAEMDVLDYGCGTGLISLFLLPHVRSVTGADSSAGMLKVLDGKIRDGGLQCMQTRQLDLERDSLPDARYHLIVAGMVLHHVRQTEVLLKSFYQLLLPGGTLAVADLDTEPGIFHRPDSGETVYHHGFDRDALRERLHCEGFADAAATTAHVIRKPIVGGALRDFPVFLLTAHRPAIG